MDRLTLITKTAASITDHSNGSAAVVDIEDSHSVTVQGFTIHGVVQCGTASVCYLTGNTIQGGGVAVGGGSRTFLESNEMQDGSGATVNDGSQMFSNNDVFEGNAGPGITLGSGVYFEASNSSFLNNGVGILAAASNLLLHGGTVSGNTGNGMTLLAGSTVVFRDAATNNRQWRHRCPPGRRLFRWLPIRRRNRQFEWSGRRLRPAIHDHSLCRKNRWCYELR